MITNIRIKNFQSHKRSILALNGGVNVIYGQSDKGKTAVIRALRWVLYNKPSGDAIRSYWGGDTEVTVTLSDDNTIQRKKTNTENSYTINEDKPLKAFGQSVPEEVLKILNLDEVNIQQQMDAPFLLSETSGEVAQHFNRVAGISVIDKSIANAKKQLNQTNQSIRQWEEDYTEKLEQHKKFAEIEKTQTLLEETEAQWEEQIRKVHKVIFLKEKVIRLKGIKEEQDASKELLKLEPIVTDLLDRQKSVEAQKLKVKKIKAVKLQLERIDLYLREHNQFLAIEPTVNSLLVRNTNFKAKKQAIQALKNLVGKHTNLTKIMQGNAGKIAELVSMLPDVCPMCNGTGKIQK